MKKMLKMFVALMLALVVLAGGLIGALTVLEYKPDDVEMLFVEPGPRNENVQIGKMLNVITLNTGYGSLGRGQDFFMDGGKMTRPDSPDVAEKNVKGLLGALQMQKADLVLLQEVDLDSYRSHWMNQADVYRRGLSMNQAFAYNYKCEFVPFPWPPIGKVESGLVTLSNLNVTEAARESLPVPFAWPVRAANLKRCLLTERIPVEGTDKELVVINLHLEAYDDGEGKIAQTKQLMQILEAEYRNGNYVIAGGDFNQVFEGAEGAYPLLSEDYWQPGQLYDADLPDGFRYVFDASSPTCRLLNKPYSGSRSDTQLYVIDGFIVSDNLHINHAETLDWNFEYSDHNPVFLQVTPR